MRTSYHPRFLLTFFSFFLNLDNIIIKLVNVRGTMRKEAEVNHAYIYISVQEPVIFFVLPGMYPPTQAFFGELV